MRRSVNHKSKFHIDNKLVCWLFQYLSIPTCSLKRIKTEFYKFKFKKKKIKDLNFNKNENRKDCIELNTSIYYKAPEIQLQKSNVKKYTVKIAINQNCTLQLYFLILIGCI
jgi:hypothetical protein